MIVLESGAKLGESRQKKRAYLFVILTQAMVLLFSIAGILSKVAAGMLKTYGLFSFPFLAILFLAIAILGVYAFFWQKILKHTELSVAYLSKGVGLLWTLVWSKLIFGEVISLANVLGVVLIIIGIVFINLSQLKKEGENK